VCIPETLPGDIVLTGAIDGRVVMALVSGIPGAFAFWLKVLVGVRYNSPLHLCFG
jgi:hypothetical protein